MPWLIMVILVTVIANSSFMVLAPPILISTAQSMVQSEHGTLTISSMFTPRTCTAAWLTWLDRACASHWQAGEGEQAQRRLGFGEWNQEKD